MEIGAMKMDAQQFSSNSNEYATQFLTLSE
jgi:hypothetical protein